MKKFLSVMLAFVMAVCLPVGVSASETARVLPEAGESVGGNGAFTVKERGVFELTGVETVLFEHEKTGAQVFYIASQDINRYFSLSFKTPKLDNEGLPHVLEHSTINGSVKYPSANLFYPISNRTYRTLVNAFTSDMLTQYPLMSLSEDQLLKLADFYLSGAFFPLLLEEERLYEREAWRYELADAESPIIMSGTVYNEMRGSYTFDTASLLNARDALFPDSNIPYLAAGMPENIPDLTWQELKDYHAEYYHPSNSMVLLYGDLDYEKFLDLTDEYFSQFEKSEIDVESGLIDPVTEPAEKMYYYPMEAGAKAEDASSIYYSYVMNGADIEELIGLSFALTALSHESSPLVSDVRTALPGALFGMNYDITSAPVSYMGFQLNNADAEDAGIFKRLVDKNFAAAAEEGFNRELIDAIIASEKFAVLSMTETPNLGFNIGMTLASYWAANGSLEYYNDYLSALDSIEGKLDDGYLEGLVRKYFMGNNHNAVAVTVPQPGKAEENAAALAAELAGLKASMTEEEIAALVTETAEMAEWSMEEPPAEMIAQLQAVSVDTLPEEAVSYEINEREENGVHYMTSLANVSDIGSTQVLLDISSVTEDELLYLKLYNSLMGSTGTENYTPEELNIHLTRYLNGISIQLGYADYADGYVPVLSASWNSLSGEYAKGIELVKEILFTTDVSDAETVKNLVTRLKNTVRSMLNISSYNIQIMNAYAKEHEKYAFSNYIGGLAFYEFLIEAEKALETDPDSFIQKLSSVAEKFAVRDNITVLYAGNEDGIAAFEENIGALFEGLPEGGIKAADYSIGTGSALTEAIVVDSAVQYNMIYASLEDLGLEFSGKLMPVANFIKDKYLSPQIRNNIGAYDNISIIDENGFVFLSYSDPSVTETNAVYDGLADFLNGIEITQAEIDDYILRSYSDFAVPQGELSGAVYAMMLKLTGKPADYRLRIMSEIKSLTVEDIKGLADELEKMADEGYRSTSGGAAAIAAHADLFEEITDINAMDAEASAKPLTFEQLAMLLMGGGDFDLFVQLMGLHSIDGFQDVTAETEVTREQFAVVIAYNVPLTEVFEEVAINDIETVSEWAVPSVKLMINSGLMSLDADGNFDPQGATGTADYEAVITGIMARAQQEYPVETVPAE